MSIGPLSSRALLQVVVFQFSLALSVIERRQRKNRRPDMPLRGETRVRSLHPTDPGSQSVKKRHWLRLQAKQPIATTL